MSLYHEAADLLTGPVDTGGNLKSRIFNSKNLKSAPAQIYALIIETCKWSFILKEAIENASLLNLERKLTPVLSLLLVHDLLCAKKGIALPAAHGLRAAVERHKTRLQAELTKARIRRKLGSIESLREYVESGEEGGPNDELPHPRWVRINTLRTQLEDQLETTFAGFEIVQRIADVRQRGSQRLYIDQHVPNLVAVPASAGLTNSQAYTAGDIIFQEKASCFPAYILDPLGDDGDIIDACAAPGNKTTHLAAILKSHAPDPDEHCQTILAFEKDEIRADTLKKMVNLAQSQDFTRIYAGQDFLKTDPNDSEYRNVGALLLDPSCSGSGIVGRDYMPELHLPSALPFKDTGKGKPAPSRNDPQNAGEKRGIFLEEPPHVIDDDGKTSPVLSDSDLQARLQALSSFQLSLLLHAMVFPSARKIAYSTCSIHFAENEGVVLQALASDISKEKGWRLLKRTEQVRGMREWPIRGEIDGGGLHEAEVAEACVRTNKGDEHGTIGFFVACLVRERDAPTDEVTANVVRDERGFIIRDLMGIPLKAGSMLEGYGNDQLDGEEWNGFSDGDDGGEHAITNIEVHSEPTPSKPRQTPLREDNSTREEQIAKSVKKRKRKRKG